MRAAAAVVVVILACTLPLVACQHPAGRPRSGAARAPAPAPLPLLVDVDMGLDDARVLLTLTRQERYRIEAITTVEGSSSARRGADNALRLLAAAGIHDVPVAAGAERALGGPVPAPPWRELTERLGGIALPAARRHLEPGGAVTLLRERLRSSHAPLPCLALGPVTNLALVLRAEPGLARRFGTVYLLGDFVGCEGFNCRTDPQAARELRASGVSLYMVIRTATDTVPFDRAFLGRVQKLGGPVARLIAGFMAHHASPAIKLWDDAVLGGLLQPSLLRSRSPAPNVRAATWLDAAGLQQLLLELWDRVLPAGA